MNFTCCVYMVSFLKSHNNNYTIYVDVLRQKGIRESYKTCIFLVSLDYRKGDIKYEQVYFVHTSLKYFYMWSQF